MESSNSCLGLTRIAQELGVSVESPRNWVHRKETDEGQQAGLPPTIKRSCGGCGEKTASCGEEREILKKAAAFFAQETDGSR
jgi:transposase